MTSTVPPPSTQDGPTPPRTGAGLRATVLRGGVTLSVRQAVTLSVSAGGILVVTRILGPNAYGSYAVALALALSLVTLSDWGVDVFLTRWPVEREDALVEHQALTVLLAFSAAGTAAAVALLPLLRGVTHGVSTSPVCLFLVLLTPVTLVAQVPMARLNRRLEYRRAACVDVSSQVSMWAAAVPLALLHLGAWAPAAGYGLSQVLRLVLSLALSGYRPRLAADRALARAVCSYGFGYSASVTVWQLRDLVSPLVVARFAGISAAGEVALAIRLVGVLSFVRSATWNLSIAALARLQSDRARLAGAVREGSLLQVLALAPFLCTFAVVAQPLVHLAFGPGWPLVPRLFPLLALGSLANAAFSLHSSALYVLRANWSVALFHAVHVALFAGAALVAVPRYGALGYGVAELVALPSYWVVHRSCRAWVGATGDLVTVGWVSAFGLLLFADRLGPLAGLPLAVLVMVPSNRRRVAGVAAGLRRGLLRAAR